LNYLSLDFTRFVRHGVDALCSRSPTMAVHQVGKARENQKARADKRRGSDWPHDWSEGEPSGHSKQQKCPFGTPSYKQVNARRDPRFYRPMFDRHLGSSHDTIECCVNEAAIQSFHKNILYRIRVR
jgi:hypothetical protein